MKLAQTHYDNAETGCCAKLDIEKWDGKTLTWKDKPFLKDHIRAFLHIPLNFGSVISRDHTKIEQAGAYPEDPFWLTDEVSPWGSNVYVAVDRSELPGATIEKLSGTFITKVFDGPYRDVGKWMHQMDAHVHIQGRETKKVYFFYATCPKCSKHFGKNHVVLFAQVD
jgi:hypothetical protein